jgi:histidinol-phosphate aminotransferase
MKLRAALADLPKYIPGRPPAARPGLTTYKISSNENPYAPLRQIVDAAQQAVLQMNRYPDMGVTELHDALASRFDVPAAHIATGTGSVGLLQQFVQATCDAGDEVVFAWRAFEAYPIVATINGAVSVRVPLRPDESHDLDAMAAAITERTKLILVCQPNNPTGVAATRGELDAFIAMVPKHVLVVIDEAYVEFVTGDAIPDGLEYYRTHENVAVLRTFSKAFGLAGLRVGYAIAHDDVAAALRACAVPFGVSGVAQAAAVAALKVEAELQPRVAQIVAAREEVTQALRSQGWQLPDSQANFVWLRLGERAPEFAAFCDERGLAVRPYGTEGVRVTVGDSPADARFIDACNDWLATHNH